VEIWYNTSAQPTKGADSMYCITWHRQKRIVYSSLCLLSLISLLLHAFTFPQEQEVWGEDLVPWLKGAEDLPPRQSPKLGHPSSLSGAAGQGGAPSSEFDGGSVAVEWLGAATSSQLGAAESAKSTLGLK
jgi:hypothetical protein